MGSACSRSGVVVLKRSFPFLQPCLSFSLRLFAPFEPSPLSLFPSPLLTHNLHISFSGTVLVNADLIPLASPHTPPPRPNSRCNIIHLTLIYLFFSPSLLVSLLPLSIWFPSVERHRKDKRERRRRKDIQRKLTQIHTHQCRYVCAFINHTIPH